MNDLLPGRWVNFGRGFFPKWVNIAGGLTADDVVVSLERKRDAETFLRALAERLGQFDLALHPAPMWAHPGEAA